MNRSFFTINKDCTAHNPVFERVNRHISLPPIINADKKAILNILRDHHSIARISWPDFEVKSATSRAPNSTSFTFKSKYSTSSWKTAVLTDVDDGIIIHDVPYLKVTCYIKWTITEAQDVWNSSLRCLLISRPPTPRGMDRTFLAKNRKLVNLALKGKKKPLPVNINTDKDAILRILYDHDPIARTSWCHYEVSESSST
ncbi:uncharacterized protein EURHEDRAFT_403722 [Aspergillus ruber CBS 135680]|uniref:Uncharacterized protein n=1 Tax=Aspergillus ruber (strain CBS 135680) TaxID=1388766 RepID=A0A017SAQ4_ASPRC|nr:uncharacterized protein EURHEDRAFT_403722 [Aspergillus ruber CBS 135680]EYE94012.1 hypothetical protein EURHEDRAFT_403722 [Aspergillus ruber CBS 135680]